MIRVTTTLGRLRTTGGLGDILSVRVLVYDMPKALGLILTTRMEGPFAGNNWLSILIALYKDTIARITVNG